jgi:hypothetical protein
MTGILLDFLLADAGHVAAQELRSDDHVGLALVVEHEYRRAVVSTGSPRRARRGPG